jgi:hypothetical protein
MDRREHNQSSTAIYVKFSSFSYSFEIKNEKYSDKFCFDSL